MENHIYGPILRKINDWIYYDDNCPDYYTNRKENEEFRSKHDLDCILTNGNLYADTIFSLWLPLRFTLVRINGYDKLNSYGNINSKIPFLRAINDIEVLKNLLPSDNDTVIKLSRLFDLGQQRCNVMILRDRAMQSKEYDYMPRFLYECFSNGKFSRYFKDDSDLVDWIYSEKLNAFFDGPVSKDNIRDLSGTGNIKNNIPEDMNLLLDNYISLLIERNKQLSDEKIDESVGDFLGMINSIAENGPFRKHRRLSPAFETLGTANNEFYEYAFFERSLEWFTRDILINQSLMGLFHLAGIECLWPEKKKEVRFSNEAIENIYPFEFIVLQDEKRIGYRYTGLCENEVDDLINDYHLDRIVQIDWKLKKKCDDGADSVFTTVSFEEFLECYFPDLDCESIIAKFKKAIKEANEDIGFETIPRLSLRYLSNFKDDIDYVLSHEKYRDMRFLLLPDSENKEDLSNIVLDEDDYKICDERFIDGKLYKALLGEEGFAKCFVTAEYQYHVFKQGNSFDYTSVVCGYLKAIEQLLYKLLRINLDNPSSDRLWILSGKTVPKERQHAGETTRRNPATGKWQVVFDKDFEMYFNITLSPMIWFLHDNVNGWLISDDGRKKVHKFLLNFANDCRNDHFHKDNIDDYDAVKGIRNNTILLAYLLIGGYKMTGNVEEDRKVLGVQDDSFDHLYKKIQEMPRGIDKFILKYADGKTVKAYRHFYQENTVYDASGSVSMSRIKFVLVDEFSMDIYDAAMSGKMKDKEFYIEKDNMPLYVAYINGRNEEVEIDF